MKYPRLCLNTTYHLIFPATFRERRGLHFMSENPSCTERLSTWPEVTQQVAEPEFQPTCSALQSLSSPGLRPVHSKNIHCQLAGHISPSVSEPMPFQTATTLETTQGRPVFGSFHPNWRIQGCVSSTQSKWFFGASPAPARIKFKLSEPWVSTHQPVF